MNLSKIEVQNAQSPVFATRLRSMGNEMHYT
jgi:hypothetical protein